MRSRWDPWLYRGLSDRFDRMAMFVDALPGLGPTWTELLISRVELMHALWTEGPCGPSDGRLACAQARHRLLLAQLRRKADAFLPRPA